MNRAASRLPATDLATALVAGGLGAAIVASSTTVSAPFRLTTAVLVFAGAAIESMTAARRSLRPALLDSAFAATGILVAAYAACRGDATGRALVHLALPWAAASCGAAALSRLTTDGGLGRRLLALVGAAALVIAGQALLERFFLLESHRDALRRLRDFEAIDPRTKAFLLSNRARASFGQANALAGFLLLFLPLGWRLAGRTRSLVAALPLTLVAAGLLATGSKGGLLCAIGLTGLSFADDPSPRLRQVGIGILLVFLLLAVALTGAVLFLGDTEPGSLLETLLLRRAYWRSAFDLITAHPVLGVGLGGFGAAAAAIAPGRAWSAHAHQIYLEVAAELGLPVLLLLGLVLVRSWRRSAGPPPAETPATDRRAFWLRSGFWCALFVTAAVEPGLIFVTGLTGGWHRIVNALILVTSGLVFESRLTAPLLAREDPAGLKRSVRLGLVGFLVHGLVDFDLQVPGLIAALGLLAGACGRPEPRRAAPMMGLAVAALQVGLAMALIATLVAGRF